VSAASESDVAAIVALRCAVARQLGELHGRGHWAREATDRGVASALNRSSVLVGKLGEELVAVVSLTSRKPWAIDRRFFSDSKAPLYLIDMAVAPRWQGRGFGRRLLEAAKTTARARGADAIRLDAYDSAAGAGSFYAGSGFREVGRKTFRGTPLIYYEWVA